MAIVWVLAVVAALLLLNAASRWLRLVRRIDRRSANDAPTVPVLDLQAAAQATALALGSLAIALLLGWAFWHRL